MMVNKDYLSETLFGKTRRSVLSVLYRHVDESFYLRQLVRVAGGGMGAVQREVKALTAAGIIVRTGKNRQTYYQANSSSPIFGELKSIIMKTAGMGDLMKVALTPLAERIQLAFVYGSLARGDENKRSDVDVMIIGDVTFAEVVESISTVQQEINREINPTVYPVEEFQKKLAAGHHFIKSVYEGEKLFLIGDKHDLARMAD
jgi:predicted nucleotidyltransferase